MSEIETVYETHDDGVPALWTERDDDGTLSLCDDSACILVDEEELDDLVAHWREVWCESSADDEIDADGDCIRCGHPANGSSGHGTCDGPAHR